MSGPVGGGQNPRDAARAARDQALGAALNKIYGCVFIGMGLLCLAAMLHWVVFTFVPELRYGVGSARWQMADGVIVTSTVEFGPPSGQYPTARPVIRYEYTLPDGRTLSGTRLVFGAPPQRTFGRAKSGAEYERLLNFTRFEASQYPQGQRVRVAYDPADPSNAVLQPGLSAWLFISSAAKAIFASLFGAGLIWIGRKVMRMPTDSSSPAAP